MAGDAAGQEKDPEGKLPSAMKDLFTPEMYTAVMSTLNLILLVVVVNEL